MWFDVKSNFHFLTTKNLIHFKENAFHFFSSWRKTYVQSFSRSQRACRSVRVIGMSYWQTLTIHSAHPLRLNFCTLSPRRTSLTAHIWLAVSPAVLFTPPFETFVACKITLINVWLSHSIPGEARTQSGSPLNPQQLEQFIELIFKTFFVAKWLSVLFPQI